MTWAVFHSLSLKFACFFTSSIFLGPHMDTSMKFDNQHPCGRYIAPMLYVLKFIRHALYSYHSFTAASHQVPFPPR